MYELRLNGILAKIERANEHRDSLDAYITEMFSIEANCPTIGVKFKPETGEHVVYVSRMPETMSTIVIRIGVLLGDVAHNLRSALDHLAFQLALRNNDGHLTAAQERRVQFPIEDEPAAFERRCAGPRAAGWIADVHPDDQAILKRFQVFNRIDGYLREPYIHPLGALRDLSNHDKHRLVTTVGAAPATAHGVATDASLIIKGHIERSLSETGTIRTRYAELGAELFRAVMPDWTGERDVEVAGYVAPQICLETGRPVIETIDRIGPIVTKVVREFVPPDQTP